MFYKVKLLYPRAGIAETQLEKLVTLRDKTERLESLNRKLGYTCVKLLR